MKAFHTIAVPHKDILEGRLTMDVYAAELWDVFKQRGADEYKDKEIFFNKTYPTQGLENLLNTVKKRLDGKGGDPVIQLQTPFGGGKTHSLIAIYHKASEWDVKPVVIVGEKLKTGSRAEAFDTVWGLVEEQLTGSKKEFDSSIPPGGDQVREMLETHQPVLILIDEMIPYLNSADAVTVGNKSLTSLTLTFLHNLTNVVSQLPKVSLVFTTTPSNPYDRTARGEEIVHQLQNITARREIIKTPISDEEISHIIGRRLFSQLNESEAKNVVLWFMDYAEKENVLPANMEASQYRDLFLNSYPFLPEVINILYHRWGSFPKFQRTRGVLRLLSLVVHSLKETNTPYISLADFELSNPEIRQELIRHTGQEFNGIIASDITDKNSGSRAVDISLGQSYKGLKLGTRTATSIFMYSFSGGPERGATTSEIKLSATTADNPASMISDALDQLKRRLFYLQAKDKYYFSNVPNLNLIHFTKMENVKEEDIEALELALLKKSIRGDRLQVFLQEENSANIPDTDRLKLVVLQRENPEIINHILRNKGQTPRVYRNTLFFLYPLESERQPFKNILKRRLAYELILQDEHLQLTEDQRKEVKRDLEQIKSDLRESLRRLYRLVAIPDKKGFKTTDLGIPTYGEKKTLDQEVYDSLRLANEIIERIAPVVIREKYLGEKDYVSAEQIYQSSLKTPGETRFSSPSGAGPLTAWQTLTQGVVEGTRIGVFGVGELKEDNPVCLYFKEEPFMTLSGNEILMKAELCSEQREKEKGEEKTELPRPKSQPEFVSNGQPVTENQKPSIPTRRQLTLKFEVPKGKISNIMGIMNLLQSKFESLEIEIDAKNGSISEQEIEDKIMEAFRQLGIKPNI